MSERIGVYLCHCGSNIAGTVDIESVRSYAEGLEDVVASRDYKYMCSDPGQDMILKDIRELGLTRIVVASCSPLMHERTFRRVCEEGGLNPFLFQMANVREHCSWVTEDTGRATEKAKRLVGGAVRRVARHEELVPREVEVRPEAAIVGGGIAGIEAALRIAAAGRKVYLIEREPSIGGHMAQFDKTFPTLDCAACILTPKMVSVAEDPNIEIIPGAEVEEVSGHVGQFRVKVRQRARYVDLDRCTGCGECEAECPVEARSEFDLGLSDRKAIYRPFPQAVPNAYAIDKKPGWSPCRATCPAAVNPHAYIALIRKGKPHEAAEIVRRRNPFAGICGRICHHPCEDECLRGKVDEPVAISLLKRFAADREREEGIRLPERVTPQRSERVAVIGAGPAGLTAARDLLLAGFPVTVFEKEAKPGGMLSLGIPAFRLPQEIVEGEIAAIEALGVEIRTGVAAGDGMDLDGLLAQGFGACIVATGMTAPKRLSIPGADAPRVLDGLEFLRDVRLGKDVRLAGRVLVIGGGGVAMDAARTALRLGLRDVHIACLESREEMPALPWEVQATEEEIIATLEELKAADGYISRLHNSVAPQRILVQNGEIAGVEFLTVKSLTFREDGSPQVELEPGSEHIIPADTVIVAIGQASDRAGLERMGLETDGRGCIRADPVTLATSKPRVFACGDAATGPGTVVEAVASAHEAAESVRRLLEGEDLREGRGEKPPKIEEIREVRCPAPRHAPRFVPARERIKSFVEVDPGLDPDAAAEEALRCLACSVCSECLECVTACGDRDAIRHDDVDRVREIEVGTVIAATGFRAFDASRLIPYGYGVIPNVVTALEFERLCHASGPTGGKIVLRDGRVPERIAILHCVGSRDENYCDYCSRVCCMYALKFAHLAREKTDAEVYELYIDMRAFGKEYEAFYKRCLREGVHLIRGRAAEISTLPQSREEEGRIIVRCEDTLAGRVVRLPVDMVVLATALEPAEGVGELARALTISRSRDGFFLEKHPKLEPVSTASDGIFLAGACQAPKDIPDTVAQAGAAAAAALGLIDAGKVLLEPITAEIDEDRCGGCKICMSACAFHAIEFDEEHGISKVNEVLCKGCGSCVAACPAGAARQRGFTDEQIEAEIEGMLVEAVA